MSFAEKWAVIRQRLLQRKTMLELQKQANAGDLKRTLGVWDLIGIGIGAIIGTGIFVLTGTAAAKYAGPAVVLSFVIAGFAAGFAALAYSELASMIPVAGSAYTYTYATMGELVGWIIGWDLILEYLVGAATVSVGWSSYMVSFLENVSGAKFSKSLIQAPFFFDSHTQSFHLANDSYINLPAIVVVLSITVLLVFGIKASTRVNSAAVVIKLFVIFLFIFACCSKVDSSNLTPWVPPNQGGSTYGAMGVFTGATTVFFAYIGFDAVSTAAQEARNPQRDLPIGITVSLVICTVLYIAVSVILTGIAPYGELNVPHPITYAVEKLGWRWLTIIIDIGAVAGLSSVLLILLMGQPRILYAMASDGLLPKAIAKVHPTFQTPYIITIITGIFCAIAGGLLPIDVLGEMTSIGTLFAFFLVNVGVIILRVREPDMPRRFRMPGPYFIMPIIGALMSVGLIATATTASIIRLFIWMAIGLVIYASYGYRHSYTSNPELRPKNFGASEDPFSGDAGKSPEMHQPESGVYSPVPLSK